MLFRSDLRAFVGDSGGRCVAPPTPDTVDPVALWVGTPETATVSREYLERNNYLDAFQRRTTAIVLISKPPSPAVARKVLAAARACGKPVVATNVGGPPEFVPTDGGVLVNPLDTGDIARGLAEAATLPSPNDAARAAAAEHDVRRQAERVEAILLRAAQGRRA